MCDKEQEKRRNRIKSIARKLYRGVGMGQGIKKGSLVKQAAILAAAGFIVRILGFLYRVPLTNMIGDEGNGLYTAAFYIYMFFLVLSSAGLPAAISKMVSERVALKQYKNAHRVFQVSMLVAVFTGTMGSLILWFGAAYIANSIDSPGSYYSILTLSPTILIVAVMAVYRGYFQGMNNMVPTAISQIIEQIFNAIFSVYMAYILVGDGIEWGAAGGTMGTGIGAFTGLLFLAWIYMMIRPSLQKRIRKYKANEQEESYMEIGTTLLRIAVPIITGTAIFSITNLIDVKMVMSRLLASGYDMKTANILYGQLSGKYILLTTLPVSIATALATAVVPSIASSMALEQPKVVRQKINLAMRVTMLLAMPSTVGMAVLGGPMLIMLFPKYPGGGILLTVGSIAIVFLSLAQITTAILQGVGRVSIPAINAGIGAVFKIIFNYLLIGIPGINVLGAVISTVICYMVAGFLDLRAMVQATGIRPNFKTVFTKPFMASLGMGVICYVMYELLLFITDNNTIATLTSIMVGIWVYFGILFMIRGISKADIELLPMGKKISAKMIQLRLLEE